MMRINGFVLCDDIRNEVGNKKSLMGVYTKEIVFPTTSDDKNPWPRQMNLAIMLDFTITGDTKRRAEKFVVSYVFNGNRKKLGEGTFTLSQEECERDDEFQVIIFSTNAKYSFDAAGTLTHLVSLYDGSGNVLEQTFTPVSFTIRLQD